MRICGAHLVFQKKKNPKNQKNIKIFFQKILKSKKKFKYKKKNSVFFEINFFLKILEFNFQNKKIKIRNFKKKSFFFSKILFQIFIKSFLKIKF